MNKKFAVATLLVLILAAASWAFWPGKDPQLAEIDELSAKLRDENEREKLTEEERREAWREVGEKIRELPEEKRDAYFRERREEFMEQMEKRMTDFFAMPKEEQMVELDKRIDEMEERRKEWEARRAEREANGESSGGDRGFGGPGGPGGRGPGGGGPGPGGGERAENGSGGSGGDAESKDGGRRRPNFGNMSEEQRNEFRKRRLDHTKPEMRAMFTEYRKMMEERRKERGLPEGSFFRGR